MYRKKGFFILLLAMTMLASCSSIPLGTMLRFRNYSSNNLKEIEPEEFRARITHQDSLIVKPEKSFFSLALFDSEKKENLKFPLELVKRETVKKGLFKRKQFAKTTLKMTDEGMANFIKLQKDAGEIEDKYKGIRLSVNCSFDSVDKYQFPERLELSVELKLNARQDFFTLINNAKIDMKKDALKPENGAEIK